ncbi:GldG family protein [Cerasicoccus fimbriatus]|uniref:GldG family protein n=1 Tax=Cerasicoccus fimbriatus TaxID=3014554 RepID=UPI0022B38741|nr:GldG family protein [Cerasicoccus sp. TK19100]
MSALDDFRIARWVKRLNRTIQILLSLTLAIALNLIAAKHFMREDITRNHRYSLAPETLAYLQQIEEPIRIIVTEPTNANSPELAEIFADIQNLLREFQYASRVNGKQMLRVDYINIYKDSLATEELVRKYNVKPAEEAQIVVVVTSGDEYTEVYLTDMYRDTAVDEKVFTGEQAITTAVLDVMRPDKTMLYFTTGHSEMNLEDVGERRGLSQMATFLRKRNYRAKELDLTQVAEAPEDASVIIVAAPQLGFLPEEQEILRQYLDKGDGRLIVLLDPAIPHGLDDLFYDWGVLADDMIVLEASDNFVASGGDMLVAKFAEHPTTDYILKNQLKGKFGLSRPVRIDPGSPLDDRLQAVELVGSSAMSWGERNYRNESSKYDQASDLAGPVSLAVVSERVTGSDLGLDLQGGKLAVFGNSTWLGNSKFNIGANPILFNNVLNWMLERDEMVNIPPQVIERHQLLISQDEAFQIYLRLLTLPGGVALVGMLILMLRRR